MWRARKPRSWWVSPEYVALKEVVHVLELANWQRGGGKKAGPAPKPPKLPEDKEAAVKSADELTVKRRRQSEHLRRRRAQLQQQRGTS